MGSLPGVCKKNSLSGKSDNIFGMELGQLGIVKERKSVSYERVNCYVGVKLRDPQS